MFFRVYIDDKDGGPHDIKYFCEEKNAIAYRYTMYDAGIVCMIEKIVTEDD